MHKTARTGKIYLQADTRHFKSGNILRHELHISATEKWKVNSLSFSRRRESKCCERCGLNPDVYTPGRKTIFIKFIYSGRPRKGLKNLTDSPPASLETKRTRRAWNNNYLNQRLPFFISQYICQNTVFDNPFSVISVAPW